MSLDVKILGLDQKVDFSDGSVSNIVQIELPDGSIVPALVTDASAQQVLTAVQLSRNVFKEAPTPAATSRVVFAPRPVNVEPPSFEFGGEGPGAGDDNIDQDEDEPVVGPQFGPTITRMRAPSADDAGNPLAADGTPLYENMRPPVMEEEDRSDEDGMKGL